jgi:hypothetical protein
MIKRERIFYPPIITHLSWRFRCRRDVARRGTSDDDEADGLEAAYAGLASTSVKLLNSDHRHVESMIVTVEPAGAIRYRCAVSEFFQLADRP